MTQREKDLFYEVLELLRKEVRTSSYNNNYGLRHGSQPRLFPSQSRSC